MCFDSSTNTKQTVYKMLFWAFVQKLKKTWSCMLTFFLEMAREVLFPCGPFLTWRSCKCCSSVDVFAGLEVLATTIADIHRATVWPNLLLIKCWQRLESLATGITGSTHLSLFSLCFVLHQLLAAVKNRSRYLQGRCPHRPCQLMSTSLHVLLKSEPCLESFVAEIAADPRA